jgi:hypothetical protein
MIELGIKELIEHLKTVVNADLFIDNEYNLFVNGITVLQDLSPEAIDDLKLIWQSSGLSEAEFITYFDDFVLREIQNFLNPTPEENKEE